MNPVNYFAGPGAYNTDFFSTVIEAAVGVSSPFLVQQGNLTIQGASPNGATVTYNNLPFDVYTSYINPNYTTPDINTYFIPTPPAFQPVWPTHLFPNSAFIPSQAVAGAGFFKGTLDCVGFGCRVLVAAGNNTPQVNAYCQLLDQVNMAVTEFASHGWVPTALQVALAWPVLRSGAWSYIAGGLDGTAIQTFLSSSGKTYTGQSQGGFSKAQAGDILSFGYTVGHSNGHFMVLTAAPQPVASDTIPNLASFVTQVYSITVLDSTDFGSSLHYNDSRVNNAAISCGIGTGALYILANEQDEPVGFVFGPNDPPHYLGNLDQTGTLVVAAITVGRFQ